LKRIYVHQHDIIASSAVISALVHCMVINSIPDPRNVYDLQCEFMYSIAWLLLGCCCGR
jgi:hypothetical protein